LMVLKAAKWHLWPRLDLLWEPRVELIRNFQTVSGRVIPIRFVDGTMKPCHT
jgi:hypothetical protein